MRYPRGRRGHAERVIGAAAAVLAADEPDADRRALAELLAEIGAAWSAVPASALSAEQVRWSRVCATASKIAERIEREIADEAADPRDRWCILGSFRYKPN